MYILMFKLYIKNFAFLKILTRENLKGNMLELVEFQVNYIKHLFYSTILNIQPLSLRKLQLVIRTRCSSEIGSPSHYCCLQIDFITCFTL